MTAPLSAMSHGTTLNKISFNPLTLKATGSFQKASTMALAII